MSEKMINLLPESRQRMLAHDYYYRMGVIAMILFTMLIFIAAVLLIPRYVFVVGDVSAKTARFANITSTPPSADETALSSRLAALSREVSIVLARAKIPTASSVINTILAVPRSGVSLTNISYVPATEKTPGSIILAGTATTRDALRAYQMALQEVSLVRAADLPVAVYAKDTNIPFTIKATLTP